MAEGMSHMTEVGDISSCQGDGTGVTGGQCGCGRVYTINLPLFVVLFLGGTLGFVVGFLHIGLHRLGYFPNPFYGRRARRRPGPPPPEDADDEGDGGQEMRLILLFTDDEENPVVQEPDPTSKESQVRRKARPSKRQRKVHAKRMKIPDPPRRFKSEQQPKQSEGGQPRSQRPRNQRNKLKRLAKRAGAIVNFMKGVRYFLLKKLSRLKAKLLSIILATPSPLQVLKLILHKLKLKKVSVPKQPLSVKKKELRKSHKGGKTANRKKGAKVTSTH